MLNRKSIGIEINEDYVKIGLRRLELATEYNGERLIKIKRNEDIQSSYLHEQTLTLFSNM